MDTGIKKMDLKSCLNVITSWLLLTLLCVRSQQTSDYIQYTIQDDYATGEYVGNIVQDSDLRQRYSSSDLEQFTYKFLTEGVHKDYFLLDKNSGDIESTQPVDRDEICPEAVHCALRLDIAVQPSRYFEIIKVVIAIEDRNDNSPSFSKRSVSYEFLESTSPGISLVPVELAKDIDSPRFGVVSYHLRSDTDVFGLDVKNSSGNFEVHLTLKSPLDREVEDQYRLLILAKDGGSPSRTGTLTVNIRVLDINDNNPKFESSTYEVNIPENLTPGTSIITIKATDDDIGLNGEVLYSFNQETVQAISGTFSIERATGMVYLQKAIDYEKVKSYSLIIVAQDQGTNSLPANTRVLVNVMDVNDHAPVIILNTLPDDKLVKIEENKHPEVFVVHITIYDADEGPNGHVECFLKGDEGKFQIIEIYDKEFKIVTTKKLDREEQHTYVLYIECRDYGQPQLSAEDAITIEVLDINDNPPVFTENTYTSQINEHCDLGTSVVKVKAVDHDSGNNGRVNYFLEPRMSHMFEINPRNGEIVTLVDFDREETQQHVIQVVAKDNGVEPKSATATVIVDIQDIDDHGPTFTKQMFHLNVSENMPSYTLVGYVHAVDHDSKRHSKFSYYISSVSNAYNRFKLDEMTGRIETLGVLDREIRDRYTLTVTVQSNQTPHKRDTAHVEIRVLDKNDNAPVFAFPSQFQNTTVVSNRLAIGQKILQIRAYDNDTTANGQLTYSILEGNENGYFHLNPQSGDLMLRRDISNLFNSKLYLKFLVEDSGSPPRMDISMLFLVINATAPLSGGAVGSKSQRIGKISGDLLAVIVGCVCGAIVIILAVVLGIILLMRRRKKKPTDNQVSWYSTKPSTSPTKEDLAFSEDIGSGSNDSSRKLVLHALGDNTVNKNKPYPVVNGDVKNKDHFLNPAPLMTSSTILEEQQDKDSGCADLSQGSTDDNTPKSNSSVTHPAKVYSKTNTGPIPIKTSTGPLHQPLKKLDLTLQPPQRLSPLSQRGGVEREKSPPYPGTVADRLQHPVVASRPYIDPIPPTSLHPAVSPSLQQSFAEWLNSEGEQLKNQGHKYRVNNHHHHATLPNMSHKQHKQLSPNPHSHSPHLPIRTPTNKKTVRFTEPDESPESDEISSDFSQDQSRPMIPRYDDYQYSESFDPDVKPSKSDGNIYRSFNPDLPSDVRQYGSLDRRRNNNNIPQEVSKTPMMVYSNSHGQYNIGHSNDGSLV